MTDPTWEELEWTTQLVEDPDSPHDGLYALYHGDGFVGYYRTREDAEGDVP